jgi:hypothetical protein
MSTAEQDLFTFDAQPVVAAPKVRTRSTGHTDLDSHYDEAGEAYHVDPDLLLEQGRQESMNFHPRVLSGHLDSPKGARGVAQFMPDTARQFGLRVDDEVDERTDPRKSILAQGRMMSWLLGRHGGDERAALAGYNSGHNLPTAKALRNADRIPETRGYVSTIIGRLGRKSADTFSFETEPDDLFHFDTATQPSDGQTQPHPPESTALSGQVASPTPAPALPVIHERDVPTTDNLPSDHPDAPNPLYKPGMSINDLAGEDLGGAMAAQGRVYRALEEQLAQHGVKDVTFDAAGNATDRKGRQVYDAQKNTITDYAAADKQRRALRRERAQLLQEHRRNEALDREAAQRQARADVYGAGGNPTEADDRAAYEQKQGRIQAAVAELNRRLGLPVQPVRFTMGPPVKEGLDLLRAAPQTMKGLPYQTEAFNPKGTAENIARQEELRQGPGLAPLERRIAKAEAAHGITPSARVTRAQSDIAAARIKGSVIAGPVAASWEKAAEWAHRIANVANWVANSGPPGGGNVAAIHARVTATHGEEPAHEADLPDAIRQPLLHVGQFLNRQAEGLTRAAQLGDTQNHGFFAYTLLKAATSAGFTVTELATIKRATGASLPVTMGSLGLMDNLDKSPQEQAAAVAKGYFLGQIFEALPELKVKQILQRIPSAKLQDLIAGASETRLQQLAAIPSGAVIGGGLAAYEGKDKEHVLADALTWAGVAALPEVFRAAKELPEKVLTAEQMPEAVRDMAAKATSRTPVVVWSESGERSAVAYADPQNGTRTVVREVAPDEAHAAHPKAPRAIMPDEDFDRTFGSKDSQQSAPPPEPAKQLTETPPAAEAPQAASPPIVPAPTATWPYAPLSPERAQALAAFTDYARANNVRLNADGNLIPPTYAVAGELTARLDALHKAGVLDNEIRAAFPAQAKEVAPNEVAPNNAAVEAGVAAPGAPAQPQPGATVVHNDPEINGDQVVGTSPNGSITHVVGGDGKVHRLKTDAVKTTEVSPNEQPSSPSGGISGARPDVYSAGGAGAALAQPPQAVSPVPESRRTVQAQFRSARDPESPRDAVLVRGGQHVPRLLTGFAKLELPDDVLAARNMPVRGDAGYETWFLYVNRAKWRAKWADSGLTRTEFVRARGFEPLIGKVEPVSDTSQGLTLRTEAKDGSELSSSVVQTPAGASVQAEVDRAQFPEAASQELLSTQAAVAKRAPDHLAQTTEEVAPPARSLRQNLADEANEKFQREEAEYRADRAARVAALPQAQAEELAIRVRAYDSALARLADGDWRARETAAYYGQELNKTRAEVMRDLLASGVEYADALGATKELSGQPFKRVGVAPPCSTY